MIYEYECTKCGTGFEVIKPLSRIDDEESCPDCDNLGKRMISRSASFSRSAAADWNTEHYNHAMGKGFTSNSAAKKEAKARGMIEIGDEPVEKIHKHYDEAREKKIASSYDDLGLTDLGNITS